jgi:hypothetical protein
VCDWLAYHLTYVSIRTSSTTDISPESPADMNTSNHSLSAPVTYRSFIMQISYKIHANLSTSLNLNSNHDRRIYPLWSTCSLVCRDMYVCSFEALRLPVVLTLAHHLLIFDLSWEARKVFSHWCVVRIEVSVTRLDLGKPGY